jgi:hypothetical protein
LQGGQTLSGGAGSGASNTRALVADTRGERSGTVDVVLATVADLGFNEASVSDAHAVFALAPVVHAVQRLGALAVALLSVFVGQFQARFADNAGSVIGGADEVVVRVTLTSTGRVTVSALVTAVCVHVTSFLETGGAFTWIKICEHSG